MKGKKKMLGLTIATAAAVAFATAPITSTATYAAKKVPCYGVNACNGQSQCKTATSDCKGKNDCKGKGYLMKTASRCKKMGGNLEEPKS